MMKVSRYKRDIASYDGLIILCIVGVVAAAVAPKAFRLLDQGSPFVGTAILAALAILLLAAFVMAAAEEYARDGFAGFIVLTVVVLGLAGIAIWFARQ